MAQLVRFLAEHIVNILSFTGNLSRLACFLIYNVIISIVFDVVKIEEIQ